jgi:RNA polymerase sigma factor for flagellar operon FliA
MAEAAMENPETILSPMIWDDYLQTRSVDMRNDIVLHYSQLVKIIALRMRSVYKNYAQLDDVVNQGIVALIDAVEKYEPNRGIKFETFAAIKVKGAIIDYIRTQDWIPRRVRKHAQDLEDANNKLCADLNRQPTHQELAKEMNLTLGQLDSIMEQTYTFNLLSYEEVLWQRMSALGDDELDANRTEESPERRFLEEELRGQLAASLDTLNERERLVVSLYYHERLKFKEISGVMGVSESRVCQIHSSAILKMKKNMHSYINV